MEASLMICAEGGGSAVAIARVRDSEFLRRAISQAKMEARERAIAIGERDRGLGEIALREVAELEQRLTSLVGPGRCGRRPLHTLAGRDSGIDNRGKGGSNL